MDYIKLNTLKPNTFNNFISKNGKKKLWIIVGVLIALLGAGALVWFLYPTDKAKAETQT